MSIDTWVAEFAPMLDDLHFLAHKQTWLEATQWSIRKWIGLRPKNLERHDIDLGVSFTPRLFNRGVIQTPDSRHVNIDYTTCPLCLKSFDHTRQVVDCTRCPLYRFVGRTCDGHGAYGRFLTTKRPAQMIKALQGTAAMLKAEEPK
jgi:hypothetical protein